MTEPMTTQQLCDYAATEIMGWEAHDSYPGWWWKPDGESGLDGVWRIDKWTPHTDLNQLRDVYLALDEDAQVRLLEKMIYAPFDVWFTAQEKGLRAIVEAHKEGK